ALADLKDIKGQESAKRALEVAAAGGHNLLMVGPPGAGKSMLAARLPTILPPLTPAELLEVSMIASVAGEIEGGALTNRRPFRAPHHSASMPAPVGGGLRARPGEVSLAHHGVLFLDELPEFQPQVLDSLRQPLEIGEVAIARANHRVTYPARFMLVAAMNPCRCGRASEPGFTCKRGASARCAAEYQGRLSGPLIDRIDLHIEVPAVTAADLILPPPAEGSREVAARVARARAMQEERYAAVGHPPGSAARGCEPPRPRTARFSKGWRGPTRAGLRSCATPPMPCGSRRAAIIACCEWRARSPISTAPKKSAACISPRRCPTARSSTRCAAPRERELGLEAPQRHFLDQMALDLLQDQVGALARRQDVLTQIEEIDARPDRGRGLDRLRVRQRRIAVKVRFGIAERGAAQGQEPVHVPAL